VHFPPLCAENAKAKQCIRNKHQRLKFTASLGHHTKVTMWPTWQCSAVLCLHGAQNVLQCALLHPMSGFIRKLYNTQILPLVLYLSHSLISNTPQQQHRTLPTWQSGTVAADLGLHASAAGLHASPAGLHASAVLKYICTGDHLLPGECRTHSKQTAAMHY
jgi:hypothetical protein